MKAIIVIISLCLCILIFSIGLYSQDLPSTDIYLASISVDEGRIIIGDLKNITNYEGYDNQPSFLADGKSILFSSVRVDSQADIYKYDIDKDTTFRLTATGESEYSPTLMPDGQHFSVVRVENDLTQRLWKFALDGTNPELVLKTIKPVGYHCWIDSQLVAVFVVGKPDILFFVDMKTERPATLANNIGRSLNLIPGLNLFTYVEKEDDSTWLIKVFDPVIKQPSIIIPALPGSEDFTWLPDGTILMGDNSILYKFNTETDPSWQPVADFSGEGITSITRLAVSPDGSQLAIVALKK